MRELQKSELSTGLLSTGLLSTGMLSTGILQNNWGILKVSEVKIRYFGGIDRFPKRSAALKLIFFGELDSFIERFDRFV